jgi:hypothetical protein
MRRVICSLAVIGIFVTVFAVPANAVKPDRFQPGPAPDLEIVGVCPFPVLLHDVVNTIVIKDFLDQDGNLVKSIGTGRLLEEVSRLDAPQGNPVETITRNISGPGHEMFDESGSTLKGTGPWLLFGFPGEFAGFPDGFIWFTTGQFVLRFEGASEITMVKEPKHEDVCELLS